MATTPLNDTEALDQITDLFADEDWNGADICEAVSEIIAQTNRPHPGIDRPRADYVQAFTEATGRQLPDCREQD